MQIEANKDQVLRSWDARNEASQVLPKLVEDLHTVSVMEIKDLYYVVWMNDLGFHIKNYSTFLDVSKVYDQLFIDAKIPHSPIFSEVENGRFILNIADYLVFN